DFVAHDEIRIAAPLRMNLDQSVGHLDDADTRRNRGADVEREVDVVDARHIAASQHRFANLGPLLRCQIDVAAALFTLVLTGALLLRLLGSIAVATLIFRTTRLLCGVAVAALIFSAPWRPGTFVRCLLSGSLIRLAISAAGALVWLVAILRLIL